MNFLVSQPSSIQAFQPSSILAFQPSDLPASQRPSIPAFVEHTIILCVLCGLCER